MRKRDSLGKDPNVRDGGLLSEDGEMGKDVDGGDVGGEEKKSLLSFTEGLDDLLDSSLELTSLGSWVVVKKRIRKE